MVDNRTRQEKIIHGMEMLRIMFDLDRTSTGDKARALIDLIIKNSDNKKALTELDALVKAYAAKRNNSK